MSHEQAWAEALATEHAHQRELLATLHGELGTFAKECAAALASLDAYVATLGGVVAAIDTARQVSAHADLAADLYARFAGDSTLPFQQAEDLLRREPKRSDRELLQALVDAVGVRHRVEQLIGPAPIAALSALAPLARWKESKPTLHDAVSAAATQSVAVADAQALASTLHDAVGHVQNAATEIRQGRLEQVLAEARVKLETDLQRLHDVVHDATDTPREWLDARHDEWGELVDEVEAKLDRVEKIRRALGLILPHLQTLVRGLAVAERIAAVERHRNELLSALATVWDAAIPGAGRARTLRMRSNRRWLVAAGAVLVAALFALVLALANSGSKHSTPAPAAAAPTVAVTPPAKKAAPKQVAAAPTVSPVRAEFVEAQRETVYAVSARSGERVTYSWQLKPPSDNPTCTKFAPVPGKPYEAVWHHADTDGCAHTGFQHLGLVTVTVSTPTWQCVATFFGTLTKTGPAPQKCRRA